MRIILLLLLLCSLVSPSVWAEELVVGVKESPPFAMQVDGKWQGISVDLWRQLADEMGVSWRWQQQDLTGLLNGVEHGEIEIGIGALTITAGRESVMDFSHPFYTTGIGIAVPRQEAVSSFLSGLVSVAMLRTLAALALLLMAVGALVWWFERKRNPDQFGGRWPQGLASGFWWSAVTMTTVGYGDKSPITFGGKLVALVWMFAGLILISGFTAAITTALTVNQLGNSPISSADDLAHARLITIGDTASSEALEQRFLTFATASSLSEALQRVASGEFDAVAYDEPILRHLISRDAGSPLMVLPFTIERQDYGVALVSGSPLREPLNIALQDYIHSPAWKTSLYRYLGRSE